MLFDGKSAGVQQGKHHAFADFLIAHAALAHDALRVAVPTDVTHDVFNVGFHGIRIGIAQGCAIEHGGVVDAVAAGVPTVLDAQVANGFGGDGELNHGVSSLSVSVAMATV